MPREPVSTGTEEYAWNVRRTGDRSEAVRDATHRTVSPCCYSRLPPESPIERARGAVPCSIRLRCSSKSVLKLITLSRAFTNWLQGNNKFNRFIMPRAPPPPTAPSHNKTLRALNDSFSPLVKIKQICLPPATPQPQPAHLATPSITPAANTALSQTLCL